MDEDARTWTTDEDVGRGEGRLRAPDRPPDDGRGGGSAGAPPGRAVGSEAKEAP